jgi:hypothetical protein
MAWPDVRELWAYWQTTPPPHVALACLAIGQGCMQMPRPAVEGESSEADLLAFEKEVKES